MELKWTWAFYESPFRAVKSLEEIRQIQPDRKVVLARELTKKFEEVFRGTAADAVGHFSRKKVKGELLIMVEGSHA